MKGVDDLIACSTYENAYADTREELGSVTVSKLLDSTSPELFRMLVDGDIVRSEFRFFSQDKSGIHPLYTVLLENARITQVQQISEGDRVQERVTFSREPGTGLRIETVHEPSGTVRTGTVT